MIETEQNGRSAGAASLASGYRAPSGFADFIERLRRRAVGLVLVPHMQVQAALHSAEKQLPGAEPVDVLEGLSASDVERLTAERLHERAFPPACAAEDQSRLVLRFEVLFHVLSGTEQDHLKRRLAAAEPRVPGLIFLHSPLTVDRLADRFEDRLYRWPAA